MKIEAAWLQSAVREALEYADEQRNLKRKGYLMRCAALWERDLCKMFNQCEVDFVL